jgi:5-hydroxyisourate hydrolase-like protein (transthyretin family)
VTPKTKAVVLTLALLAAQAGYNFLRAQSPSTPANSASTREATGTREISGVVLSAKTAQLLPEADVNLWDTVARKTVAETTSDDEGRFSFVHLPDSNFRLQATHRGYVAAAFEEHEGAFTGIVTGEGLVSTGLRFALAPQAVIYGTVADDSGDPVPQAQVSLYRQDHRTGTGKMVRANNTNADARGNFEFAHLASGSYYIAVVARPWYATHPQPIFGMQGNMIGMQEKLTEARPRSPLDVAYAVTYYPDATDSGSAAPISVTAGDRIPISITLHPVPAVHITMQIPAAGPNQPFVTPQLRQEIFGTPDYVQAGVSYYPHNEGQGSNNMTTVEIEGVAPGQYDVEFNAQNGESGRFMSIDASSDHASIDAASASTMADVSGKVTMADRGSLPSDLDLILRPQQGGYGTRARVEADGSFHIHAVRPGAYELIAGASGHVMAVTHLSSGGGSEEGALLKVSSEPVELTAILSEATAKVIGVAQLDGKPAPGVCVVLVPAKRSDGSQGGSLNQSDSDGSFNFPNVALGEYILLAIKDGWTLDWARPEVMARYLAKGQKVTVAAHAKDIHLKDPLEVQPR